MVIEKIYYPYSFECNQTVEFYMSDGNIYTGKIRHLRGYYLDIYNHANDFIFLLLNMDYPSRYIKYIVGYDVIGAWPEVKTLEDLRKVLESLSNFGHDRIPECEKPIISDDTEHKPFTLAVRNSKNIKLDFKI